MTDGLPTPLISVVMSVYNGRRYLGSAIDSILAQSVRDFEFIIVDDGSSDGSTEDLKSYAARDPRIRLIIQENQGLTKALNIGLQLSRGEFVARMDADDVARPERFARQLSGFAQEPKLVLLGAVVELISDGGIPLALRGSTRGHDHIRQRLLRGDGSSVVHPVAMFRRQAVIDIGGYDERFSTGQDLDLFLRLSEVGLVDNLPETLLSWRQHGGSINRTRSSTWRAMKALAIEKTVERIGAKRFAEELFAIEPEYAFPSDQLGLGRFALDNRRYREAGKLFLGELKSGPRKREALEHLFLMGVGSFYGKLRRPFRRAET